MSNTPLLTVICLCFNHEGFVEEALKSIKQQTYTNIEIIIVDDASNDRSVDRIKESLQKYRIEATFLALKNNIGNCKAFNKALAIAKGEFVIDFAADDVLLPHRVEDDVACFIKYGKEYACVFSDVEMIDEQGESIKKSYFKRDLDGKLLETVTTGDVYERVLSNPPLFSAPTITFRTSALRRIGGYDETLAYEDFDVWIRLSRNNKFAFYDKINTLKRDLPRSLGKQFYYQRGNQLLKSTLKICLKAHQMNTKKSEDISLSNSVLYHGRIAALTGNNFLAKAYYQLYKKLNKLAFFDKLLLCSIRFNIDWSRFYIWWLQQRKIS
ncbi:glycosyltransferase [Flammeovirga yaeyamensis]|uniref:Glycosyltransferase n=1 Tax=Flammeovirga yaeyamensis TaxID=367791 RepID=A0AAX1N5M6_9BACT|nr:glycosyltransferase [Flammeovirga yaeyamensis]MBB3698285.1 glycosyltransferase involved in cell wall biosynthesis [Flammeovirga yaeyamensis]NMF34361.1 glycosyltransferase [Flammeovirga yaeyamensis]QWG01342.1 glycosyltransferase [Flammeovirga yaeyamensis]